MPERLRIALRATRLLLHLGLGLLTAAAVRIDISGRLRPEPIARRWFMGLLAILGIRLIVHGEALRKPRLTAANHISWLDIAVLAACEETRFIAKSEIRDWPIAGWLANAAGTFYIRRGKGGARPLAEKLVPHLAAGGSVVLFPEGTTTDGRDVRSFHARLFSAPIEADVWVQPVALRYGPGRAGRQVAPFIGDDDLVRHILRLLREPTLTVEVRYCAPIRARGYDRDTLAQHAQAAVRTALGLPPLQTAAPALAA
ncbi:lysophospholipid acyltransferase family protein [Fontimonas thermophila]|nr:lysophospholipid acyltransferase family protein [Fontimonas thermophila]